MAALEPQEHRTRDDRSFTIRSAAPEDAGTLLDFLRAAAARTELIASQPDEFPATVEQERTILAERAADPAALYLVALAGGVVVGCLGFSHAPKRRLAHTGELGLIVGEAWRGRGVGRALMRVLIEWARGSATIEKLCLSVFSTNAAGIALYESLGFEREGQRRRQVRFAQGRYADEILMGLWLRP